MSISTMNPDNKKSLRLGRAPWLLSLAIILLVGVLVLLGWLLLGKDGELTMRQIEAEGVRLSVPQDWNEEDISQNEFCQQNAMTCVTILTAPEGYNFSLTWYTLLGTSTVQLVDENEWRKFREQYPEAILFAREEITVGGLPAIQRTFLQNNPENTPIYFRQVYILEGQRLYLVTARFFSAETMDAYAGVVDQVIASIKFTPIEY